MERSDVRIYSLFQVDPNIQGATDRMVEGDLEAGSNQVDNDNDEGTDKDEFKDFPRIHAVEEGSYAIK